MTSKSTDKSNAEVAALPWINIGAMCSCTMEIDNPCDTHKQIYAAIATAQSQLAKDVLESMSTMAGGNHGGGLVAVSRGAAIERLRDLFTCLGIPV